MSPLFFFTPPLVEEWFNVKNRERLSCNSNVYNISFFLKLKGDYFIIFITVSLNLISQPLTRDYKQRLAQLNYHQSTINQTKDLEKSLRSKCLTRTFEKKVVLHEL